MTRHQAFALINETLHAGMMGMPITKQVDVYHALATVMPKAEERRQALEIAVTLGEVAKLQLDFSNQLFKPIPNQAGGKL